MKEEPKGSGTPTCCAPGDLSACVIETTEERNKTDSKAKPPKKNTVTEETKRGGKA